MIRKNAALLKLMNELAPGAGDAILSRRFEAGQRIIRQGQDEPMVYVIRSGVVKCLVTEDNDKDYIMEFLGEGEVLGELECIRKAPALSHVDTVTPLEVYVMDSSQFGYYLNILPALNSIIMESLATRVVNAALKGAKQRLYTLSELLPELMSTLEAQGIVFSKQELAEYLGISLRSLNREMRRLMPPRDL